MAERKKGIPSWFALVCPLLGGAMGYQGGSVLNIGTVTGAAVGAIAGLIVGVLVCWSNHIEAEMEGIATRDRAAVTCGSAYRCCTSVTKLEGPSIVLCSVS